VGVGCRGWDGQADSPARHAPPRAPAAARAVQQQQQQPGARPIAPVLGRATPTGRLGVVLRQHAQLVAGVALKALHLGAHAALLRRQPGGGRRRVGRAPTWSSRRWAPVACIGCPCSLQASWHCMRTSEGVRKPATSMTGTTCPLGSSSGRLTPSGLAEAPMARNLCGVIVRVGAASFARLQLRGLTAGQQREAQHGGHRRCGCIAQHVALIVIVCPACHAAGRAARGAGGLREARGAWQRGLAQRRHCDKVDGLFVAGRATEVVQCCLQDGRHSVYLTGVEASSVGVAATARRTL
jgi:hypothetical protein